MYCTFLMSVGAPSFMRPRRISLIVALYMALLWPPIVVALQGEHQGSQAVQQFIEWESQHNVAFSKFDSQLVPITHFEIQLDHPNWYVVDNYWEWLGGEAGKQGPHAVILDMAEYLPEDIRDLLIEERDGKRWARWYISPHDRFFHTDIEAYLSKREIPFTKGVELHAYSTASRTIQVVHPKTGRSFQVRPSSSGTAQGQGSNEHRPLPARWAWASRRLSDYYKSMEPQLKHLAIAYEAAAISLPPMGQTGLAQGDVSQTIRLTEGMSSGETFNMTGFVFDDLAEAKRVSDRASMSYEDFWTQAMEILGRASAELSLILGFRMTSNHTQNFRWELDKDFKLTGRMIVLDLTDGAPIKAIFEKNGQAELIQHWQKWIQGESINQVETRHIVFANFFRRGWSGVRTLPDIRPVFNEAILRGIKSRTSELTGIPLAKLPKFGRTNRVHNGIDYYSWELAFDSEEDLLSFVKPIQPGSAPCQDLGKKVEL